MIERLKHWMAGLVWYWNKYPAVAWGLSLLWVLFLGGVVFLWHLGSTGLVDETEPLFAEAARQMVVRGDWITPYFNEQTRFDKPPLIYWLMAIAYQAIGVNEWAVRLPSALSAIALVGMVFYTLRQFGTLPGTTPTSPKIHWLSAWIGAAVLSLHPLTIIWSRTGVSDMLLTSCIGLALLTFFCGYASTSPLPQFRDGNRRAENGDPSNLGTETGERRTENGENPSHPPSLIPHPPLPPSPWYLASYIFIGLAILSKGPVGIVLPGLVVLVFLFYTGNLPLLWREMRLCQGIGIILALALPWYILVTLANGDAFIGSFFGYHNVERFTRVVNRHSAPWYFYFVVVLLGFAPWSVYLPIAISRLHFWKRSIWRNQPRSAQLGMFALFWFAAVFLFFTVAVTKLPSYVLPLMPAAAILVALFWSQQSIPTSSNGWGIKLSGVVNILLFLGLAGVMLYAPRLLASDPAHPQLAEILQAARLPILGGAISIGTAALLGLLLVYRQIHRAWLVNLIGFLALFSLVLMPATFLVDSQRQLPLRQLAAVVTQARQPDEPLIMLGFQKPSLVFYTQQPVKFLRSSKRAVRYFQEMAANPSTPDSLLLLSYPEDLLNTGIQPDQYQLLTTAGQYQLVRIKRQTLPLPPE
jgi:4-amino-4-deoxy-L-arabinose transferase-like glycosyltransferase